MLGIRSHAVIVILFFSMGFAIVLFDLRPVPLCNFRKLVCPHRPIHILHFRRLRHQSHCTKFLLDARKEMHCIILIIHGRVPCLVVEVVARGM